MPSRPRQAVAEERHPHWTSTVYRQNAELFYDVEAALFQNESLTRQELNRVGELARHVGAVLGGPIVDLACGPGRHSLALSRRGFEVTGVDLSESFLLRARAAAARLVQGLPRPRFLCGDLRHLALADGSFPTVLLLGNSFGYFSDEENRAILGEMRRLLVPGGLLCLELTNRDAYLESLTPYEEERVDSPRQPLRCQWWKRWNAATQRVETLERHSHAGTGEVVYEGPYDVRLYGWRELRQLLVEAGFHNPERASFTPAARTLEGGLGETFGAMSEVLFVAARG